MKKVIMMILCGLMFSLASSAQGGYVPPFAKNKIYTSASLSGIGLSYNNNQKWNLNLDAKGGWLFEDNWMVTGTVGYNYRHTSYNSFKLGAGARYYIEQNGLYLGAGANYVHEHDFDDLMPTIQVGYAFFLNGSVTIEPEIYYDQSLKDHSEYSGFGVRIGFGIYFY